MIAFEIFVGGQKRVMQALTMVGEDWTPSKPGIGSRPHSPPVTRAGLGQFVGQRPVDGICQLLLLVSEILLRVPENLGELGRWVLDAQR